MSTILRQVRSDIPTEDVMLSQAGTTDLTRWADIAGRIESAGVADDVRWALDAGGSGFTRQQILDISDSEMSTANRRRFIATLMWGYGTADLRYPSRVDDLVQLFSVPGLDDRLNLCVASLVDGDIASAYSKMTGIRNLKSAYFTKFLYFAGKVADPAGRYPLVLDTKVSNRLARLTGYSYLVITEQWPRDDAATYVHYIRLMHRLAADVDVSADALELYLFDPSPAFGAACDAAHWLP